MMCKPELTDAEVGEELGLLLNDSGYYVMVWDTRGERPTYIREILKHLARLSRRCRELEAKFYIVGEYRNPKQGELYITDVLNQSEIHKATVDFTDCEQHIVKLGKE